MLQKNNELRLYFDPFGDAEFCCGYEQWCDEVLPTIYPLRKPTMQAAVLKETLTSGRASKDRNLPTKKRIE